MRKHFTQVLDRERAALAEVTDRSKLVRWRRRVVEELMTPESPYVLALRQTGDARDRADFLGQWRELIAGTVDRLVQSEIIRDAMEPSASLSARSRGDRVNAQETAVLILAALHGGCALSQVAQDPWPLDAALDLALAPLAPQGARDCQGHQIE